VRITNRIVRVLYAPGDRLIVSDVVGRIHELDERLRPLRSSPVLPNGSPMYAVAVADDWVVGKDRMGGLYRWRLDTLDLMDCLDPYSTRREEGLLAGEEPSPVLNRGITVWNGKVYVNNGYLQFVILDLQTFSVEEIAPSISGDVPVEWICVEHPDVHAISDKDGNLFLGRLDTLRFPVAVRIDDGSNLHRVRYDRLHDRFWVTQDSGEGDNKHVANGIATVRLDGSIDQQLCFTADDVECLEFTPDGKQVYVGGFDGQLRVFDNTGPALRMVAAYGGFSHQISDVVIGRDGHPIVLTQDGNLVRVNPDGGRIVDHAPFEPQAVWDIQPAVGDPDHLYCAMDDGVAVVAVTWSGHPGGPRLVPVAHHLTGFGFTRRVVPLPDGCAGITRDRRVFRLDREGRVVWERQLAGLIHTLAVSPDHGRILVASNAGGFELDATNGSTSATLSINGLDLWVCGYTPKGDRMMGTHNGVICAFAADAAEEIWRLETGEYPKRLWWDDDRLYVTGEHGLKEIEPDGSRITRRWKDGLINTCENGAIHGGRVYAVSYNSQLAVYDYDSGEYIGVIEDLPDFPKGVTVISGGEGPPCLIIGGRGGYLRAYRIDGDEPLRLYEIYLPRRR
jgi:outer membrane protein assembly factor BamB